MVPKETDVDVVLFVSTEQYPTTVYFVTDFNISLKPNEVGTVRYYSPCVEMVFYHILYIRNLN